MDVLVLTSQNGDWEGLFVNEDLVSEGHKFYDGRSRFFLLELAEKYGFTSKDVREAEVNREDDVDLYLRGSFPEKLYALKGTY